MKITGHIVMTQDAKATLGAFRKSVRNKIMRAAVRTAKNVVRKQARQEAQAIKVYGFLAKATADKVKTYGLFSVAAIIGQGVKREYTSGIITRGPNEGKPRIHKPARYAHLVEKGTRRAEARHFLRSAYSKTWAQYREIVYRELERRIAEELRKAAR